MFLGTCRTPEITCPTDLENWGDIPAGAHRATGDSDVVTGQSFTIAGGLEGELRPKVSKPVPPAAQCDAIDRVLISLANDQSVSLVKSDLHQMFKFSQFQLGSLYKVSEMGAAFVSPYDMIITS